MVEIDSFTALIGAAQANVIELHTWNATTRDTTRPDRIVFDLDPGEGVSWKQIQEGTELTRALLEELGLASLPQDQRRQGPARVGADIAEGGLGHGQGAVEGDRRAHGDDHPGALRRQERSAGTGSGKIFVDYLRNGFGATTVCAWSARARPGLGVSVPVRVGRARRADRRRALDDPQPARADRGACRSVAGVCEDAADAGEGGEDAGGVLTPCRPRLQLQGGLGSRGRAPVGVRPRRSGPLRGPDSPALLGRGARCGTRYAPSSLRSDSRSESDHEARAAHARPRALRCSAPPTHADGCPAPASNTSGPLPPRKSHLLAPAGGCRSRGRVPGRARGRRRAAQEAGPARAARLVV